MTYADSRGMFINDVTLKKTVPFVSCFDVGMTRSQNFVYAYVYIQNTPKRCILMYVTVMCIHLFGLFSDIYINNQIYLYPSYKNVLSYD